MALFPLRMIPLQLLLSWLCTHAHPYVCSWCPSGNSGENCSHLHTACTEVNKFPKLPSPNARSVLWLNTSCQRSVVLKLCLTVLGVLPGLGACGHKTEGRMAWGPGWGEVRWFHVPRVGLQRLLCEELPWWPARRELSPWQCAWGKWCCLATGASGTRSL